MRRIYNSHDNDRRRVFVTDIIDKVVKGIGTGVDIVGSKTKELWDSTRIKSKIGDLKADRHKVMEELGEEAYEMLRKNAFNFDRLYAKAAEITEIDKEIAEAEEALANIREESDGEEKPEATEIEESAPEPEPADVSEEEAEEAEESCSDAPKCACGASIVSGARYCIFCGRPVPSGSSCD
jgi:hypothetical protein